MLPNSIIKYLPSEDEGRNCPVCSKVMIFLDDGFKRLVKCINCGYSHLLHSGIDKQHRYDLPVVIVSSFDKKSWIEVYQPLDEKLFNLLIEHDRTPDEAVNEVIRDLNLSDIETMYFLEKVKNLENQYD